MAYKFSLLGSGDRILRLSIPVGCGTERCWITSKLRCGVCVYFGCGQYRAAMSTHFLRVRAGSRYLFQLQLFPRCWVPLLLTRSDRAMRHSSSLRRQVKRDRFLSANMRRPRLLHVHRFAQLGVHEVALTEAKPLHQTPKQRALLEGMQAACCLQVFRCRNVPRNRFSGGCCAVMSTNDAPVP